MGLYRAGVDGITLLAQVTTDGNGAFVVDVPESNEVLYLVATITSEIAFLAILENTSTVVVNELTTVAAVWSAAQFLTAYAIQGDAEALRIVQAMNANLVDVSSGRASQVLQSPPNADQTNAFRSTLALANVLAACVADPAALADLFEAATLPGAPAPTNSLMALRTIARNPANHAGGVFVLSRASDLYEPRLERQPEAWTIVVKVNDSGNDAYPFGGPGNLAFDASGNAWIANNVVQGEPVSTQWSIVLRPDGRPAPMSPFTGGGLNGPGYGVDVDHKKGRVWFGNFGWGGDINPGSASLFDLNAKAVSPAAGYGTDLLDRVQGVFVDPAGNVWLASYGNGRVVVYIGGNPDNRRVFERKESFSPFDVAVASDGTAWATNSDPSTSSIVHLAIPSSGDKLTLLDEIVIGRTLKGIVIDSSDNIWVASGGNDHVYAFDSTGKLLGGFQGGGMDGPWGLTLDGNDDVWVGNFGALEAGTVFSGRVTQLAGARTVARNPRVLLGDALTPQSGYTLPTAGDQVLLSDDTTPLYGNGGPPCYTPMFRTTGLKVDRAGNVWTCNNWKPDFDIDTAGGNPGGDGMLIFVGVATPV